MKGIPAEFWSDISGVFLRLGGAAVRERGRVFRILLAGFVAALLLAVFFDVSWGRRGDAPFGEWAMEPGRVLSRYLELHWVPLIAGLTLWGAGYAKRRVRWREAAVAALLAAALAGAIAAGAKGVIGRARPNLHEPYAFSCFSKKSDLQSFPSGHTTHCVAFAIVLIVLVPELTIPATLIPLAAIFGRLALHRHYPSDIVGGAALGGAGAWVAIVAVRCRRPACGAGLEVERLPAVS